MSGVFRPWDADDEEYAGRLVVRALLPAPLRPAIRSWLAGRLNLGYGRVDEDSVNAIQSALNVSFGFPRGAVGVDELLARVQQQGDQLVMRVVDLLVSGYESPRWTGDSVPPEIEQLKWHLDQNRSAVRVSEVDGSYRLARRLPDGVEDAAGVAVAQTDATAGRHLKKAWDEIRGLQPNVSSAMSEAIRAVEASGGQVVIPKDRQPRLGKIVSALKNDTSWTLSLPRRDDDHPDQRLVLIGMLEVLAFAEQHRHSGLEPDVSVALGHVQLASTLVGWFSGNVVEKGESVPGDGGDQLPRRE